MTQGNQGSRPEPKTKRPSITLRSKARIKEIETRLEKAKALDAMIENNPQLVEAMELLQEVGF